MLPRRQDAAAVPPTMFAVTGAIHGATVSLAHRKLSARNRNVGAARARSRRNPATASSQTPAFALENNHLTTTVSTATLTSHKTRFRFARRERTATIVSSATEQTRAAISANARSQKVPHVPRGSANCASKRMTHAFPLILTTTMRTPSFFGTVHPRRSLGRKHRRPAKKRMPATPRTGRLRLSTSCVLSFLVVRRRKLVAHAGSRRTAWRAPAAKVVRAAPNVRPTPSTYRSSFPTRNAMSGRGLVLQMNQTGLGCSTRARRHSPRA